MKQKKPENGKSDSALTLAPDRMDMLVSLAALSRAILASKSFHSTMICQVRELMPLVLFISFRPRKQ